MTWPPLEALPVLLFWPAVMAWLLACKWWSRRSLLRWKREVRARVEAGTWN